MASFGTDHIINPYEIFSKHLAMAVHALGTHLLHEWLTGCSDCIVGSGTEAGTLPPAGIEQAVGIVAGSYRWYFCCWSVPSTSCGYTARRSAMSSTASRFRTG